MVRYNSESRTTSAEATFHAPSPASVQDVGVDQRCADVLAAEIARRALASWRRVMAVGGPPPARRIRGIAPSTNGTVAEVVSTDARKP